MIVQKLEGQDIAEGRKLEMLNCEPTVPNEIKDQDRLHINNAKKASSPV